MIVSRIVWRIAAWHPGTVEPRLPGLLDYPHFLLWCQFCMNNKKSYFEAAAKLFSFKLCDETQVRTEFVSLKKSTKLKVFRAHTP